MFKTEEMEALPYCMVRATWILRDIHLRLLQTKHHELLLCVIGFRRKKCTNNKVAYEIVLDRAKCASVGTMIRKRIFVAGALFHMNDRRLPKQITFGELADGKAARRGRPEKNWMCCIDNDKNGLKGHPNWDPVENIRGLDCRLRNSG